MVKAIFIKADPLQGSDIVTYILKGPKDKEAMKEAVDLYGTECVIIPAQESIIPVTPGHIHEQLNRIREALERLSAELEEAVQP